MMKLMKALLWVIFALPVLVWIQPADAAVQLRALNYHNVGEIVNPWDVSEETLRRHFVYLREHGFQPISLDTYIAAREGRTQLPDKAVILTFDDGYRSFYTKVFPLLKEFHYPAVLAMVTSWQTSGAPEGVGSLITWEQAREVEASGLVEIASHSHDLHHPLPINAFGDMNQAASTFAYQNGHYETLEEYQTRVGGDLAFSQRIFITLLGHPVRALAWPYGEYTQAGIEQARAAGFTVLFTLGEDINSPIHLASGIKRSIVYGNPDEQGLAKLLEDVPSRPIRAAQLDLDLIYDASPQQLQQNLQATVLLLRKSAVNTVFLQAFADPKGNGAIESVYFYSSKAPIKKDIFSHVAQHLRLEGFRVYAWLPTLACQWLIDKHPEDVVEAIDPADRGWYRRATPFSSRVTNELRNMVRDLAMYSPTDGILFQDDLYLNDFEDVSPAGRMQYRQAFQNTPTKSTLRDPATVRDWGIVKTQALNDLTLSLASEFQRYRPQARIARNIYPSAVLNPNARDWLAQDYAKSLSIYDYTVIMAYPYMEKAPNTNVWLQDLARSALAIPGAAAKTVFKLQAFNWDTKQWVPDQELANQVDILKQTGAVNVAIYPTDVFGREDAVLPFAEKGI